MWSDFEFQTSLGEMKSMASVVLEHEYTVLHFSRYIGCTICQLDLLDYKDNYNDFQFKNTEVITVLQSNPEMVSKENASFPFIIACDPKGDLYQAFEVGTAKSTMGLLSLKTVKKAIKAKRAGLEHGEYEGQELQLPALFVFNRQKEIVYSKYAKDLGDLPSASEVLQIIEKNL